MTIPFFSALLFLFYLVILLQTTWVSDIFASFHETGPDAGFRGLCGHPPLSSLGGGPGRGLRPPLRALLRKPRRSCSC